MKLDPERRKELLERLAALQNMTAQNGCSEHEAQIAARKATALMQQYGLSLEELREALPDSAVILETIWTNASRCHPVARCILEIGRLTNTEGWTQTRQMGPPDWKVRTDMVFAGLPADVEVAKFLVELFKTSMEVSWSKHWKAVKATAVYSGQAARSSFLKGMAHRLNERIRILVKEREAQAAPDNRCREMIRLTDQLVHRKLEQLNIKLRIIKHRGCAPNSHFGAGYQAGDGVSMSAGFVEGKNSSALLR